jgi:hypothetical protein
LESVRIIGVREWVCWRILMWAKVFCQKIFDWVVAQIIFLLTILNLFEANWVCILNWIGAQSWENSLDLFGLSWTHYLSLNFLCLVLFAKVRLLVEKILLFT